MAVRPTLRLVIGLLCAGVVLIVAIVTLAITYSVSLTTVRDIGKKHAVALATTARLQTAEYFEIPTRHLDAIAVMHALNNTDMPSNLPVTEQFSPAQHEKLFFAMYLAMYSVNFTYTALGTVFEDGSGAAAFVFQDTWLRFISRFVWKWPATDMIAYLRDVYLSNGTDYPYGDVERNLWGQFAAYATMKIIAGSNRRGMWYPVSMYQAGGNLYFHLPCAKPIWNETGSFIGFTMIGRPIAKINEFLLGVKGTPSTEAFAVDTDGRMIGSTHTAPFFTIKETPVGTPPAPGCATSAESAYTINNQEFHGCRRLASAYNEYPPLQVATNNKAFLNTMGTEVRATSVGGSNYFIVSTAVPNSYRLWGLNVILCMPESDILGDIVKGRNTAIGVTAGVFVAAALLSFGLVYALLQPLSNVSQRMLDTARLRDTTDERSYSRLAEIRDLQKAYTNMNTAIKSFTRYVPRDVVKDLMSSGQLCAIQMVPQICTMLFVDIAGFTTVCERVPPDQLSDLVSQYFDRASRIVMDHDGLIDKFIGDCIMAVWGAPFAVANQEVKAVLTGKLIDRECMVEPLSKCWDEAGEQLRVRVGISTGEVLAGNMGSADRMNYTVIGDPVNLAARLESMNKQFDTRVMISEMTAEGLGSAFVLRLLMPIAVVGKDKPVKVYEVVGLRNVIDNDDVARFEANEYGARATADGDDREMDLSSDAGSLSEASTLAAANPTPDGAPRLRKSKRSAVVMIREAMMSCAREQPLVCTPEEVEFASNFTHAVHAYMAAKFSDAIKLMDKATSAASATLLHGAMVPPDAHHVVLRSTAAMKSVQLVHGLCEKYVREGCPSDFDGVYRALEK